MAKEFNCSSKLELLGTVKEAQFDVNTRRKASVYAPAFELNHLYIGWAQKFASSAISSGARFDPKVAILWDIDPILGETKVDYVSRSKLADFYVAEEDLIKDSISGKIYAEGYEQADGIVKCTRQQVPTFNNCGAKIVGDIKNGVIDSNGPMFLAETFAFICKEYKLVYKTIPIQRKDGSWNIVHVSEDGDACRVILRKMNTYIFEAPEEPIEELVKKYELFIPEKYKELIIDNPPYWEVK